MSMSISGGGNTVSADRNISTERVTPVTAPKELAQNGDTGNSIPMNITNVEELKEAELRGANYNISDEQLVKSIEKAIKAMEGKTTTLQFSVHEKTRLIAVKVLDVDTGEVIREIPPEKTLDFVAKLWEMAGLLIDERR